jgi:hypothetical protein
MSQFDRRSLALFSRVLTEMVRDGQYVDGVWHPSYACWWCGDQLGTVAAILARRQPGGRFAELAIKTFDTGLSEHPPGDGTFGPPASANEITTATMAVALGVAYIEMEDQLPHSIAVRWQDAVIAADHWLAPTIAFYVNGNVNLQVSLALYVGWLVSGQRAMLVDYKRSLAFTLHPGPKWPGFGLHYTKRPKNPLGTDGAAYLAEKGAGAPGFDPHYTILQADYASELYLLSGQTSVLRLTNLLMNQLLTRIDRATLIINTGSGSRHPQPNVMGRFESNVLPVLAFTTSPDLLRLLPKQLEFVEADFPNYVRADNDQDQVIANYALALIGSQAPALPTTAKTRHG